LLQQPYLTDKEILLVEVPTEHFGRFSGNWLNLDAHLLPFSRALHRFMVALDARHYTQVHELEERHNEKSEDNEIFT